MCGSLLYKNPKRVLLATFALIALSACSKKVTTVKGSCTNRVSTTYSGPSERSYCTTITPYPGGTTVSGHAYYKARTGTTNGLDGISAYRPIRYAEMEVLNASGTRIQCGVTAADGSYTMDVPIGTDLLTVRVNSRANEDTQLKASVLNCPEENKLYAVTDTFTPSAPATVDLKAEVTGDILGAAFNILDQLYLANVYLRSQVGNCGGALAAECTSVTTSAPKVKAYWAAGFNPNNYFGSSQSVSFYIPGYSRLFLLGGQDGDTNTEDTDHFDNSVILHEYGHFLEDIYSLSDSPAGSHSGNKVIDPRLAWSEGWGNFIQAAVTGVPYYYDTIGNSTGTTSSVFAIPIESNTVYCGLNPNAPGCDEPSSAGEGNFREFSVTRLLWDVTDSDADAADTDNDGINNKFLEIWKSLTSATAFLDPLEEYRAIGYLHDYQENDLAGASNWSSIRTAHKHGFTEEYAQYVEANGACGTGYVYEMDPDDTGDNGSFETSNLFASNDFYYYRHPGGALNLKLYYKTRDTGVGGWDTEVESDLDLFLYNAAARFGNGADMHLAAQEYFDADRATEEIEQKSKTLPAGKYLINVKTYTGRNTTASAIGPYAPNAMIDAGSILDYKLQINGVAVCPTAKPWK